MVVVLSFSGLGAQELPSVRELLFQKLYESSPMGRYQRKDFSPGVKRFFHSDRCQISDLKTFFSLQEPPMQVSIPGSEVIFQDKLPTLETRDLFIQTGDFEERLVSELEIQMSLFRNDPVIKNREVCLDVIEFKHPNAVSVGLGYLLFDPQLFFQTIQEEATDEWSLRAILAHEFAHQLQVWTNDKSLHQLKNGVRYVRDKELQADCVASAILYLQSLKEGGKDIFEALISVFVSLGDFEIHHYEGHHGTAYERSLMARVGMEFVKEGSQDKVQVSPVMNACMLYIDKMNKKFGNTLWPMGSQLD